MYRSDLCALLAAIASLSVVSCSSTQGPPSDYILDPEDLVTETHGAWIEIETSRDGEDDEEFGGEFVAVTDSTVVLHTIRAVEVVRKEDIRYVTIRIHDNNSGTHTPWIITGTLATASNGVYAIFTAPAWIIVGTSVAIAEARAGKEFRYLPEDRWWHEVEKYARLPQGLPPGFDVDDLRFAW